jgi:hypothetical protein
MLSGHIPVIEGCSAVAAVASPLDDEEVEDQLRLFIGVSSEVDEFPAPASRHLWLPEALAAQDLRAAEYARRVGPSVRNACACLEHYLSADLGG